MSIRIPLSSLTTEQIELIQKYLTLQPIEPFQPRNPIIQRDPVPPILFYTISGSDVLLPRAFGRKMFPSYSESTTVATSPFQFTGELFEHQVSIVEECQRNLTETGGTILNGYPGIGKTVMTSKMAADLGLFTLILYHRDILGTQWKDTFDNCTTATSWIVGTPVPPKPVNVVICMNTKFRTLPLEFRAKIGTLIIDEAHCFCTPSNVACLLGTSPRYIIGVTATLERPDGMESMIYTLCGINKVTRISQKQFKVIKFLTGIAPETTISVRGGVDWTDLVSKLSNDESRNRMILEWVEKYPTSKVLILTDRVEHANVLHRMLKEKGESVDVMAGTKKSYQNSRVLVGTKSKIGTGFDEKSACPDFDGHRIDLCLIVFSTKQMGLLEQTVGRAFRAEFPTIIHFVDGNDIFKRHWSKAQKWYLSRNGQIETIQPSQ